MHKYNNDASEQMFCIKQIHTHTHRYISIFIYTYSYVGPAKWMSEWMSAMFDEMSDWMHNCANVQVTEL